jgi:hypothetical protein
MPESANDPKAATGKHTLKHVYFLQEFHRLP